MQLVTGGAQPVALTYQWWNDFGLIISDTAIVGATSATYKIPETKVGYSIWCVVKATDADGTEIEADTNRCVVTEKAVAAELWTESGGALSPTTPTNVVSGPQFYSTITGNYALRVNGKGGYYVDPSGNENLYIRNAADSNPNH